MPDLVKLTLKEQMQELRANVASLRSLVAKLNDSCTLYSKQYPKETK